MTTDTDHLYLDRDTLRLLSDRLGKVRDWVAAELENAITNQVAFTNKTIQRATKDDEVPLAFNVRASDVAYQLTGTLRGWVLHVCTARDLPWPGEGRAPHFAVWLDRHLIDLALTEEAPTAYAQIIEAFDAAWTTIDRPPVREYKIDNAKVDAARTLELHADGIAAAAREIGGSYSGLNARRVRTLAKANRVTAVRCVVATRAEVYVLGEVLDAHLAHPTRNRPA